MIVEKIDFMVEIIDAKGIKKVVSSDKFYEVAIKRNSKADRIPVLMSHMVKLREGETIDGEDIYLVGMKIRRLP